MASVDLRPELTCAICLNIFTDPVTLPCGHSFCRTCIGAVLATRGLRGYSCPECREKFSIKPALKRNLRLNNIAENFQSANKRIAIPCTYCIQSAVPAVKMCLHCEASLCENHLRVHSKSADHVLTEPTTSLENRKCSVHKKVLEYYCCDDRTCICVSCRLDGDHRGHQVETLNEASEKKKEKLRNILQKQTTQREEAEKGIQTLEYVKRQVRGKAAGETERVTALIKDIGEQLEALEKRVVSEISRQEVQVSLRVSDLIQQLEIKKEELSRKMGDIEKLCDMTDPVTVLKELESDRADYCDAEEDKERHNIKFHDVGDLDVGQISMTLHSGLARILTGVTKQPCVPDASDMLLDVNSTLDMLLGVDTASDMLLGVNTASDMLLDVNSTSDMLLGVNTASDMLLGVNTASDMLLGVNTASDMLLGVNTASDMLLDVNTASDMLLGVNTASDMLLGVNTASDMLLDVNTASDMLLDVNTAHDDVSFSEDLKTVSWTEIDQSHPKTPKRFQYCPQVLSCSSFSSGRQYWEVEGSESGWWIVGMAYPSIKRKGKQSWIGDNNKSWGLERWDNQYSLKHDNKEIPLPDSSSCRRFGIFLDYEAGRLSFYELCDPIRRLHTFTATFTEPLLAVFGVYEENSWVRI